jgi:hypothetical protein
VAAAQAPGPNWPIHRHLYPKPAAPARTPYRGRGRLPQPPGRPAVSSPWLHPLLTRTADGQQTGRLGKNRRGAPVVRGYPACAGLTTCAVRALMRAASSTAAVATASQGSTGTGCVPRTAAANAG